MFPCHRSIFRKDTRFIPREHGFYRTVQGLSRELSDRWSIALMHAPTLPDLLAATRSTKPRCLGIYMPSASFLFPHNNDDFQKNGSAKSIPDRTGNLVRSLFEMLPIRGRNGGPE